MYIPQHIRMYIHFNAILRALIFFVLFLPGRVTRILGNLRMDAYYLYVVAFLLFRRNLL